MSEAAPSIKARSWPWSSQIAVKKKIVKYLGPVYQKRAFVFTKFLISANFNLYSLVISFIVRDYDPLCCPRGCGFTGCVTHSNCHNHSKEKK